MGHSNTLLRPRLLHRNCPNSSASLRYPRPRLLQPCPRWPAGDASVPGPFAPQSSLRVSHCGGFHSPALNALVAALSAVAEALGHPPIECEARDEC